MNIQWQNRQELTRHNARRWDVQGNNPVRDYSSVEKRNNPTPPRMPSGMQPAGSNVGLHSYGMPATGWDTIATERYSLRE